MESNHRHSRKNTTMPQDGGGKSCEWPSCIDKGERAAKDAEETHTKVDANMRNMELVHASDPVVASHSVASL